MYILFLQLKRHVVTGCQNSVKQLPFSKGDDSVSQMLTEMGNSEMDLLHKSGNRGAAGKFHQTIGEYNYSAYRGFIYGDRFIYVDPPFCKNLATSWYIFM